MLGIINIKDVKNTLKKTAVTSCDYTGSYRTLFGRHIKYTGFSTLI